MYIILWEFIVKGGHEEEFARAYDADGTWAQFFHKDNNYLGTELLHDILEPQRYVTIDRWTSEEAYRAFREKNLREYETIDREFEHFMDSETPLGSFSFHEP